MTRLILVITLALVANLAIGQGCVVQNDPFSNSEVVTYKFGKYIVFEKKEDKILLNYYFRFEGELNIIMPKNAIVSFKFENGEMIEFPILEDVQPVVQINTDPSNSTPIWTEYVVSIDISLERLEIFSKSKMTHVKYPDLKGGFLTEDRSKRWVKHFFEGANCILNNM